MPIVPDAKTDNGNILYLNFKSTSLSNLLKLSFFKRRKSFIHKAICVGVTQGFSCENDLKFRLESADLFCSQQSIQLMILCFFLKIIFIKRYISSHKISAAGNEKVKNITIELMIANVYSSAIKSCFKDIPRFFAITPIKK